MEEEKEIPDEPDESKLTYLRKWKESFPWLLVKWVYIYREEAWIEKMFCQYCC